MENKQVIEDKPTAQISNYVLNSLKLVFDEKGLNEVGKDRLINILFKELSKHRQIDSPQVTDNQNRMQKSSSDGSQKIEDTFNSQIKDNINKTFNSQRDFYNER